jgi:hypothetical protein
LCWFGHVQRVERKRIPTTVLYMINTCVPYMPSNTTVILDGVLFYHGYMFRRLTGPLSGYSGGLHCYYQTIYIFTITITLEAYTVIINLFTISLQLLHCDKRSLISNTQRTMVCTNVKILYRVRQKYLTIFKLK